MTAKMEVTGCNEFVMVVMIGDLILNCGKDCL